MGAAFRGSGASRKTRTGSRRFQREHPSGWGKPEIEAGAWINIPRPVAPGALGYDEMKNFLKSFLRLARRFLGPEVRHVEFTQTGVIQLPGRTD